MQTDLYVTMPRQPTPIVAAELIAALRPMGMEGVLVREWPAPAAFEGAHLAWGGEILLAWGADSPAAPAWRGAARAGDWRRLVHANYDMAIEGVTLARSGAAREIMGAGAKGFHLCLQPHGGSHPLHATVAGWIAMRTGGAVIDPFARGAWRSLLPGSLANPDRATTEA